MLYFEIERNELCTARILRELDAGVRNCECGVDCEETDYEVKTAFSIWPSRDFEVY